MTSLTEALPRIEAGLRRLGRDIALSQLQPGLPAAVVARTVEEVGLAPETELELLYGWRNGTKESDATLDDIHMFPGFYFLSLSDAIANYKAFLPDARWSVGWLPLFANGGGDFYVVDLSLSSSHFGQIRHFRIDEHEHPIEFATIGAMAATLAKAFDANVYYVDSDGYLEMNDDEFENIAQMLNPSIRWWTE